MVALRVEQDELFGGETRRSGEPIQAMVELVRAQE